MEAKISTKIRQYRKKNGITLKELSDRTGLSIGFLSQVERSVSSLTLTSLSKIAKALGINMKELIDVDEGDSYVRSNSNHILMRIEKSFISYGRLSGKFDGRAMEAIMLTMKPHMTDAEECSHEGEEFYYVLKGTAVFIIDDVEYIVKSGESIHYPSIIKHKTMNREDEELVMISTVIPPIF